ncbi:MAG: baseplate J/gp47 family protein [Undibacterium sp.]|nr:baseplate J/gp47 family protein [Undibacterium sp.]
MNTPILDFRTAQAFYQQTLELAKIYVPNWADYWPSEIPSSEDIDQDPGLVLLNLFAQLAAYTAKIENQMPNQRQLGFFQFMNMQLRPPVPARCALQFFLQPDQPAQTVPIQTPVLNVEAQQVRFQTERDLLVLPALMSAALAVIPSQDQFINLMPLLVGEVSGTMPVFVAQQSVDQTEVQFSHWFMLGDPTLFKPDDTLQSITITLVGKRLHAEYFGQWFDGALHNLGSKILESDENRQLQIVLTTVPTAPPITLAELQQSLYLADDPDAGFSPSPLTTSEPEPEYWLLVKPAPGVQVLSALLGQLPVITGVQCTFRGNYIQPQQAAFDTVLLDITNGAYPFGQSPQKNDSFYLRSDTVFARTGAVVTLVFQFVPVEKITPVTLYWQFWDGQQWQSFNQTSTEIATYDFVDTTNNFQTTNADGSPSVIQFVCPQMTEVSAAGSKGLWIRVVLSDGGYGQMGGITSTSVSATIDAVPDDVLDDEDKKKLTNYFNNVAGLNFSYTYTESKYYPPFIQSVQITYSYAQAPANYWCYNAFDLTPFSYSPFKPVPDLLSTFYFAFAPEEFALAAPGQKLTLYFYVQQEQARAESNLQWQYHDGSQWQSLSVDDASYGLSRSGIVSFIVPQNMPEVYFFSQSAFWFRVINAHVERSIRVYGIYPNCVMASNITSVIQEVLGSGNGQQFQSLTIDNVPVLSNLILMVIESSGFDHASLSLSGDRYQQLLSNFEFATIQLAADEILREWVLVDNFTFSGPTDRVFTLDFQNGVVTFGDGYNGMIPPVGHNNIVLAYYEYTQGLAGNVAAGNLSVLQPGITNISAVVNPASARGGVAGDDVNHLQETSPEIVGAGGWAVQLKDFTVLAQVASQQVAQARAIESQDADNQMTISIALLALSADPVPYTIPQVLNQVQDYVRQYCLAALAPRIVTCAPDFVPISVTAQLLVNVPPDQINALNASITKDLQAYFQPVFGGLERSGWCFGATVQSSSINLFLRRLVGVKLVLSLNVNGIQNANIDLDPHQLPVAGTMQLYLSQG